MRTGLNNRLGSAEHTVYRLYDQQDRLIYVGCTYDLIKRLKNHQKKMWWYPQIARIKTEVHPSRGTGLRAETKIRNTEHPRWNIEARWIHRHTWNNQMFSDFITALEKHPMNKGSRYYTNRISAARQLQSKRYGTNQQQAA